MSKEHLQMSNLQHLQMSNLQLRCKSRGGGGRGRTTPRAQPPSPVPPGPSEMQLLSHSTSGTQTSPGSGQWTSQPQCCQSDSPRMLWVGGCPLNNSSFSQKCYRGSYQRSSDLSRLTEGLKTESAIHWFALMFLQILSLDVSSEEFYSTPLSLSTKL